MNLNQMSLVSAIFREIARQGDAAGIKDLAIHSRGMQSVIDAANAIVACVASPMRASNSGMGLAAWLASDDTGASSKAMAHHLMGAHGDRDAKSHPLDPSDFGRCHRFLEAVPAARALLPEMAKVSEPWARLIAEWDTLTALYVAEAPTGKCPMLSARMRTLSL